MRARFAILALLPAAACLGGGTTDTEPVVQTGSLEQHDQARARQLFARHCALCHGPRGAGDGEASPLLYPPARDFTLGFFRLASTANSVPVHGDLVSTLRRGMPGSAMPPFGWMAEEDLSNLALLVRELAREGMLRGLLERAVDEAQPMPEEEARSIVARWLEPGEVIEPLPAMEVTDGMLSTGVHLYREHCAPCHGLDGKGRGGEPKRHEDGSLTWARNFTAGILKGGGSRLDLTHRIVAGMGGSAMPRTHLSTADTIALVEYVRQLIPAGTAERYQQIRTRVAANKIDAPPTESDWRRAEELTLPLAPLAWSDDSVLQVRVAALHDMERLWLRLRWADETREDRPIGGSPYADGAALQLSNEPSPPLFGMGDDRIPVNLWHWSAARWSEVAGVLDSLTGPIHGSRVFVSDGQRSDAPLYTSAPDAGGVQALEAQGFDDIQDEAANVQAVGRWETGEWQVIFSRPLSHAGTREVGLRPGSVVQFGCAIWNGRAGDHRGQKSITIWHELEVSE